MSLDCGRKQMYSEGTRPERSCPSQVSNPWPSCYEATELTTMLPCLLVLKLLNREQSLYVCGWFGTWRCSGCLWSDSWRRLFSHSVRHSESFCLSICVCWHLCSSGPMGRSLRALSRTWALAPPTTPSPPTQWWTPWGAIAALATEDLLCLRWGQKLKNLFNIKCNNQDVKNQARVTLCCAPTGNTIHFSAGSRPWLPADEGCSNTHHGRQRTRARQRVSHTYTLTHSRCILTRYEVLLMFLLFISLIVLCIQTTQTFKQFTILCTLCKFPHWFAITAWVIET